MDLGQKGCSRLIYHLVFLNNSARLDWLAVQQVHDEIRLLRFI
jgi:hypothetical protein